MRHGKLCQARARFESMPTRNVSLTPEQDLFVARLVEAGEYQNASEAIRDGLRALQQRRQEDALRLRALRSAISEGIEALDRGDFTEVGEAAVGDLVRGLLPPAAPARRPSAPRRRRRR